MTTWQHDPVLRAVEEQADPVGSLASAYPGAAVASTDPHWIDNWFYAQAERFADGTAPVLPTIVASKASQNVIDRLSRQAANTKVRFLSIRANWFRGFRRATDMTWLAEALVVVEGRNSSGKTSLSEAIEWILTGALTRRSTGDAKELANCIANQFRPDNEETWVEADVELDGKKTRLKRLLIQDYTEAIGSQATSVLEMDGHRLSEEEQEEFLLDIFGGVHPILMQHTLREFVYSSPANRRKYFERLLQIDELTSLIEKAVVGDARLKEFPCRTAPDGRTHLDRLASNCSTPGAKKAMKALVKEAENAHAILPSYLCDIASAEFGIAGTDPIRIAKPLRIELAEAREKEFPALKLLRLGPVVAADLDAVLDAARAYERAADILKTTRDAISAIAGAEEIIASSIEELRSAGLLEPTPGDRICPLCLDPRATLTELRLQSLMQRGEGLAAVSAAEGNLRKTEVQWESALEKFEQSVRSREVQLPDSIKTEVKSLGRLEKPHADRALQSADRLNQTVGKLRSALVGLTPDQALEEDRHAALTELSASMTSAIEGHLSAVAALEAVIGAGASADTAYAAKQAWVAIADSLQATADQLVWEAARKGAQRMLATIREGLIQLRSAVIEGARQQFTSSMTEVWSLLRADMGGKFSQISIPEAKGRGYKLEFEVKAVLSDGTDDTEVDALRVFSESQVNVIGIAAYVTRAAALNHSVLVFDDPVQSMDEEHFKSLASRLIPKLLDDGRQVILLTHSDSFARDLSHAHFARDSYATLTATYSRKRGCVIEEGSRRVAERLKIAEALAQDGKLKEAWIKVRFAVERLYVVSMKRENPGFNPDEWRNATAEDMWNKGAGNAITKHVSDAEPRLKDILAMSGKAAHDSASTSTTDLVDSIKYLRGLLNPLRIGAG